MAKDFPRILALLRQEKGISQRQAAASLGISQALLSHYEKGAREPGLEFLLRAAQFYEVTTDYLLGRTLSRESAAVQLPDAAAAKDNLLDKNMLSNMQRRILTNSIALLFELLNRIENRPLTDAAAQYFALCIYRVLRYLSMANPRSGEALFTVPAFSFAELCDMHSKRAELALKTQVLDAAKSDAAPAISYDMLMQEYPRHAQSVLALLQMAAEALRQTEQDGPGGAGKEPQEQSPGRPGLVSNR